MYYSSIPKLFASADRAIYNTLEHGEIQKKMSHYGFPQKRLQEGKALLEKALMLHGAKDDRYDEKQELSEQLQADEQTARRYFEDHVAAIRLIFRKEPLTLAKFRIKRIARKVDEWTLQARLFYQKVEAHAGTLESYDLSREEIAQAKAMVEAVMVARNQRVQKKGEAEEATRVRNMAIKELKAWMSEFRSIARVALKDSPQMMEALGMRVPSQKV